MFGFLLGEALRDLRRAGRVAVSAIALTTLSLTALGGFWLLSANLDQAVARWREGVRIVVYLKREPTPLEGAGLVERVKGIPGVGSVRFIGKAEALDTLRELLGKEAAVAEQLPSNPLPASLEITPTPAASTPDGARGLVTRLAAMPETEEVAGSMEWADRLAQGQRLVNLIGVSIGAVLGLAAILTVTTATTLVLHLRRQELEVMRLVGAPEYVLRLPLLLQGMLQGLAGALLAVWALVVCYAVVGSRLEPLAGEALGLARLSFLEPMSVAALMLTGTLLGGCGGWLARGRREP
ncbi:MAG TPA: permease-like cell division protein FtsX [Gemmatimonadales bacterium]|nr:permease-like cell division protein FtsX [Gemmatimonadales bacterium]